MDVRRHLLDALGYGTTKPMPEPEPTDEELLIEACEDAVAGEAVIASLKRELAETDSSGKESSP